jgi:predicted nucleic-acid-binding protein
MVSSSLVLAEFAWTLKSYYQLNKEEIVEALQAVQGIRNLKFIDHQNVLLGNELYSMHPVKYIDALIASVPTLQDGSMAIISYDKDFDRLRVKRLEPSALL